MSATSTGTGAMSSMMRNLTRTMTHMPPAVAGRRTDGVSTPSFMARTTGIDPAFSRLQCAQHGDAIFLKHRASGLNSHHPSVAGIRMAVTRWWPPSTRTPRVMPQTPMSCRSGAGCLQLISTKLTMQRQMPQICGSSMNIPAFLSPENNIYALYFIKFATKL